MSDKLPDTRGWRPRFYLPKQMLLLAASGSQPPFLIDCTTTALKSDNATPVSECRPLVRDYFSGNRLVPSSPQKRRCWQYCVCSDQPLKARQPFQFRSGIREAPFRIRPLSGSHALDPQATLHSQPLAPAAVAPNKADRSRENYRSHRRLETERTEFVL